MRKKEKDQKNFDEKDALFGLCVPHPPGDWEGPGRKMEALKIINGEVSIRFSVSEL